MPSPEVYIVSAVRTAIGSFGGTLKDTPPCELATTAVSVALQRSGCAAERIGHVVMGNVIPTETRDAYLSRVAAMNAGIPKEVPRSTSTASAVPACRPSSRRRRACCWATAISPSVLAQNP